MLRVFEFVDLETGLCHGKYYHKNPIRAASKAFSAYAKKIGTINSNTKYKIVIKECTKNRPEKYFYYEARRIKYTYPETVKIGNKTVTFNHINNLQKIPAFPIVEPVKKLECLENIEVIEKNIEKNSPKTCVITIEL
ncbi:hypothetical protein [Moumouvirus maliensis]|nr:hypothetical protein [Moumouvirus maliensis]